MKNGPVWIMGGAIVLLLAPVSLEAWRTRSARSAAEAQAERLTTVGQAALDAGDVAKAIVALQRARDLSPADPALRKLLALTQARLIVQEPNGVERDTALRVAVELDLVTSADDEPVLRSLALGYIARRAGDLPAARRHFNEALTKGPKDARAHYAVGEDRVTRGLNGEAIERFAEAAELDPDQARYHRALGLTLAADNKWARAEETLAKVVEMAPDTSAWQALGEARLNQNKYADAVKPLREALAGARKGARVELLARLGFALFNSKDYPGAIAALRTAVSEGGDAATVFNLGVAYHAAGLHAEAVDALSQALASQPNNAFGLLRLTDSLARLGRVKDAAQVADRLKQLAATDPQAAPLARQAAELIAAPPE